MNLEQLEHNTKVLEQANIAVNKLFQVMQICLLYNQGANANSCMERIKNIIMDEPNER